MKESSPRNYRLRGLLFLAISGKIPYDVNKNSSILYTKYRYTKMVHRSIQNLQRENG